MDSLKLEKTIKKNIEVSEIHCYALDLNLDDYLQIVIVSQNINLIVYWFAPNGELQLEEYCMSNIKTSIQIITQISGQHLLKIKSLEAEENIGKYTITIEDFQEATEIIKNRFEIEPTFLEGMQYFQGDIQSQKKAIQEWEKTIELAKTTGDRDWETRALNQIGQVKFDLGEFQKALNLYKQSFLNYQEIDDDEGKATALKNIGEIYSILGEWSKALDFFEQALFISSTTIDQVQILNNIGLIYYNLNDFEESRNFFEQALKRLSHPTIVYPSTESSLLNNLGNIYADLNNFQFSLAYLNQSLILARTVNDLGGEATTLNNIGMIYFSFNNYISSIQYYKKSLLLQRNIGDRSGEINTLGNLASVQYICKNFHEALSNLKIAINIIESLRTKIDSSDLRISYFSQSQDYYEFYIHLLMEQHQKNPLIGYNITALEISDRARARSLVELLEESLADIRKGIDPELKDKELQLQQQLAAKTQAKRELIKKQPQHLKEGDKKQLETFQKEINTLQVQLQETEAEIRAQSPDYADLKYPQPLQYREIQELLDEETILLSYWLAEEQSYLWMVTPTTIESYELPERSQIVEAAQQFFKYLLTSTEREKHKKGKKATIKLSQMLFAPIADRLEQKRLVIIGNGILQRLPFSALADPKSPECEPLLTRCEIISLPSIATLAQIRRTSKPCDRQRKTLSIFADPVFSSDDERVKKVKMKTSSDRASLREIQVERVTRDINFRNSEEFPRLKHSRIEAENILKFVSQDSQTAIAFDFAASRENLKGDRLDDYKYLHFITHGFYNDIHPELSGLALSMVDPHGEEIDGFLLTPDIFNLNLSAELVVLSACRSGEGKEVKGEGIVGLTRGFMYAGTTRVVMSLWSVQDEATAALMACFYKKMLQENQRPARALREAQLEIRQHSKWKNPYYWAAFVLQGEWR